MSNVVDAVEDDAHLDTPLASHHTVPPLPPPPETRAGLQSEHREVETNEPYTQHVFALSDVVNEDNQDLEPWPEALSDVTMTIAPDETYIETDSGPAARELKARYDRRLGVKGTAPSPYAITSFVNQHGKQMYRVGHRALVAPAASSAEIAAEVEERNKAASPTDLSQSPRTKRPSRMSVTNISGFLKNASVTGHSSNPKKLRKSRSISSLVGTVNEHGELTHHTGRAHSQSVTAVDAPRYAAPLPARTVDIFGELMEFPGSSSSSDAIPSYPFGIGVSFEPPLKKSVFDFLPPPPTKHIRLMQSFESGMTARQGDCQSSGLLSPPVTAEGESVRPASAIRLADKRYSFFTETGCRPSSTYQPPAEASMLTQYATTVFDVLQTYRGLPNLDKLGLESEGKTVKISLAEDQSAAPRDDPRFVIWGETLPDWDQDASSTSRNSITTEFGSRPVSTISKRQSNRASKTADKPSHPGPQRILIAATIERWIAQFTSDLNYDELLDFFLTYRTYISGVDLGHLLISRFHWALQESKNVQDTKVRQIVRVRTFVAIRYWLLTFFSIDFVPSRELRSLFSRWLNTLVHDPLLKLHSDGLGIARRLVKVAKDSKNDHLKAIGMAPVKKSKSPPKDKFKNHVLGEKFAEAVLKDKGEDSDVDLDLISEERAPDIDVSELPTSKNPANAHLTAAHAGAVLSPARPTSLPLSSFNILQRLDNAASTNTDNESTITPLPASLANNSGALSRAFVKTIGRLGRLKRVLHSRSMGRPQLSPLSDSIPSVFDMEPSPREMGPGLVSPLMITEPQPPPLPLLMLSTPHNTGTPAIPSHPSPESPTQSSGVAATMQSPPTLPTIPSISPLQTPLTPKSPTQPESNFDDGAQPVPRPTLEILPDYSDTNPPLPTPPPEDEYDHRDSFQSSVDFGSQQHNPFEQFSQRAASIRSFASSTGSFGEILDGSGDVKPTFTRPQGPWAFDIASIDELDMSDTSSEWHADEPACPPGLRKQARKLPQRKDFEFLPRRSDVSSMGIVSARDSVLSGPSSGSHPSTCSGGRLGPGIQQWQMNALLDSLSNDEEDGDVADALRRLEGQINPEKIHEKRSKVDGWVKQIQQRLAAGDYTNEEPRFPIDSDEEDSDEADANSVFGFDDAQREGSGATSPLYPPGLEGLTAGAMSSALSDAETAAKYPVAQDVVPQEILDSRMPPSATAGGDMLSQLSKESRVHQSFILCFRATTLAEQLAMIDRELFMGVKFEELVAEEWTWTHDVNVYDWSQYVKERARWKAENRHPGKTTALAAVRARFNLLANFVISEIVLTHPTQRPMVVSKFIRIAWKSYELSNFNSLVAIITALQDRLVAQAMRKPAWSRVGAFESRVFRDLKVFVNKKDDFALIRRAVQSVIDAKPAESSSHAPSVANGSTGPETQSGRSRSNTETSKNGTPTACIPFIGVYLSQLWKLKRLPDLIDPTAPDEIVTMNENGEFNAARPEVFDALAPLPPSMRLEPLVNIHKQRKIATVIKSLVAGQHVASRVDFPVDSKLFHRCLKLRAMEPGFLQRFLLSPYPE